MHSYRTCVMAISASALIAALASCASNNSDGNDSMMTASATRIENTDNFNNLFQLENVYFAGQPTEEGFEWAKQEGVKTVINIRTPAEMPQAVQFIEPDLVGKLGMNYVSIPVTPDSFNAETVGTFAREFEAAHAKGGVLFHCGSSNRVGGLWAAYLHSRFGLSEDEAIEKGKAAGLRSDSMIEATKRVMREM